MKKVSFLKMFTILATCAFVALMAAGCEKDNINPVEPDNNDTTPDIPAEPNSFIYGEDTLTIDFVTRKFDDYYGMHTTTIQFTNGCQFNINSMIIPDGDFNFININEFYTTPDSVSGAYHEGNRDNYMLLGTYSAHYVFNTVVIDIQGRTYDGKTVSAHYSGNVTDISNVMGAGSFTFGGHSYRMDLCYGTFRNNTGSFTFTSTSMEFILSIRTADNFLSGKVYTISTNEDEIAAGTALAITFTVKGDNGPVTATATSGDFNYLINRDGTVTINYAGTSDKGDFSGAYNGDIVSITFFNK